MTLQSGFGGPLPGRIQGRVDRALRGPLRALVLNTGEADLEEYIAKVTVTHAPFESYTAIIPGVPTAVPVVMG